MINKNDEVHELTKELIPFYEDVGGAAKNIIDRHIKECKNCKVLFDTKESSSLMMPQENEEIIKITPFKKLITLKWLVAILMGFVRVIILSLIMLSFINSYNADIPRSLQFDGLSGAILLYYLPFSLLSLFILWYVRSKKYFVVSLIFDLSVLAFYSNIIKFFF